MRFRLCCLLFSAWALNSPAANTNELHDIALNVLNAKTPAERDQLLLAQPSQSAALIAELAQQIKIGTPDEYRAIPSVWKIAIEAGKRNDGKELLEILAVTLPQQAEPLHDWQAVVVGGGIINGLSQAGIWPKQRIETLLRTDDALRARWFDAINSASAMAENANVHTGTRYDALRMLGVAPWKIYSEQLTKYLAKDTSGELQQGAVSGLSDIDALPAADTLIAHFENLTAKNRQFALDALLRNDARAERLLSALKAGKIPFDALGSAREEKLKTWPNQKLRERFVELKNASAIK